jgi:hypothetical protein
VGYKTSTRDAVDLDDFFGILFAAAANANPTPTASAAICLFIESTSYASAETRRGAPLRRHKEMPSASMVASQHPTLNDTILPMTPPASPVWIG